MKNLLILGLIFFSACTSRDTKPMVLTQPYDPFAPEANYKETLLPSTNPLDLTTSFEDTFPTQNYPTNPTSHLLRQEREKMLKKVAEIEKKYRRALEDPEDNSRRRFIEQKQRKMANAAELALSIEIMSSRTFYPLAEDPLFFEQMQGLKNNLHQITCAAIHRITDPETKERMLSKINKNSISDFYFTKDF